MFLGAISLLCKLRDFFVTYSHLLTSFGLCEVRCQTVLYGDLEHVLMFDVGNTVASSIQCCRSGLYVPRIPCGVTES
jgi:hypothetical protein